MSNFDDDLIVEIDDETFAMLKVTTDKLGISVDDHARLLIVESVRKDSTPTEPGNST
jgi:hypothetical protein